MLSVPRTEFVPRTDFAPTSGIQTASTFDNLPERGARPDNGNWIPVTNPFLAYISQGQLYMQGDGASRILESPFGRSLRDRAIQIYNRNAWKTQGRGGQALSSAVHACPERDPGEFRIAITSVARGLNPGELLYTLETDEISGVFARNDAGAEQRLFHTADFRVRHLDARPNGDEFAVSIYHRNGSANVAVLKTDGSDLTEVTDGESADEAPCWAPGPGRRLVFQSAGLARDPRGRYAGRGPSSVQQLDLDTGEISCLVQDDNFDFLWPRMAADGSLYYIRKPNCRAPQSATPWAALEHTVLLPFRILWVIGKLIDLFVERRTGRPIFAAKDVPGGAAKPPSSWLLMRQTPQSAGQAEMVADGVLSFDLGADGSVVYSDGFDVYRIPATGEPAAKILAGAGVELIAAL